MRASRASKHAHRQHTGSAIAIAPAMLMPTRPAMPTRASSTSSAVGGDATGVLDNEVEIDIVGVLVADQDVDAEAPVDRLAVADNEILRV